MDNALALVENSTLGLFALITGTSPPRAIRELLLPPLDIDMPAPTSSGRVPPNPIQTNLKYPLPPPTGVESLPSIGPGAYDNTVIPPSHDARTLVLCFDGTGDQFDTDVRTYMPSSSAHVQFVNQVPFRIPISYSFSLC